MTRSVREKAMANNAAAANRLRDFARKRCMEEPLSDFRKIDSLARRRLDLIEPLVQKAKEHIQRTSERRKDGSINGKTMRSELLPAEALIMLYHTIETLYEKAHGLEDHYAMVCIRTAADVLHAHIRHNPIKETDYTRHEEIREMLVTNRKNSAQEVYRCVVAALDSVNEKLDVSIPVLMVSKSS